MYSSRLGKCQPNQKSFKVTIFYERVTKMTREERAALSAAKKAQKAEWASKYSCEMDGSDKQIQWARNVRAKAWRRVETEAEAAVFGAKTEASWWISADKAGEAIDFVRKVAAGETVEFEAAQPGKIFFTCKKCGKQVEIKGIPGFSAAEKWEFINRDPSRVEAMESFECDGCGSESPEADEVAKKEEEKKDRKSNNE